MLKSSDDIFVSDKNKRLGTKEKIYMDLSYAVNKLEILY